MIGDDGEGLDGRAGQALLLGLLFAQEEGQIWCGPELPFFRYTDEGYATLLIDRLKLREERKNVRAIRQGSRQSLGVERLTGGEEQCLGHA